MSQVIQSCQICLFAFGPNEFRQPMSGTVSPHQKISAMQINMMCGKPAKPIPIIHNFEVSWVYWYTAPRDDMFDLQKMAQMTIFWMVYGQFMVYVYGISTTANRSTSAVRSDCRMVSGPRVSPMFFPFHPAIARTKMGSELGIDWHAIGNLKDI